MKNSISLHICPDDKFHHAFIRNQKTHAPDTDNEYYVISEGKTLRTSTENTSVKMLSMAEMKKILKVSEFKKYHQVVFHSLPGRFRKHLLPYIPEGIRITWIFYGYEYYHRRDVIGTFLLPETLAYYNSWQNPNFIRLKSQEWLDRFRKEANRYQKNLQRINRFAHWNREEYELIRDQYQLHQIEYVPFSMGSEIHQLVPDHGHRYLLLGHSGAFTVNHLDGMEALDQEFIDSFDRILIPFSYGANKAYEDKVRKAAEEKMGSKVLFLNQFMDRTSYFNLLSRVKSAWMPQLRGMGGGNILFCLKNNIPVVLPQKSMMYAYYTNKGFKVFAMDVEPLPEMALDKNEKKNNQEKLNAIFGQDTLAKQYRNLLSY